MNTPDRSDEFAASGKSLVTDVTPICTGGFDDLGRFGHDGDTCPIHEAPTYVGTDSEIDWDHRNEKIDSALRFGTNLRDLISVAWGGNPGTPAVSLGVPDVGVVTFIVHTPHGDYVVKALRIEEYAQEF